MDMKALKEIAPGVFQKNPKTFYIKCAISGELLYCCKERLEKLVAKYGSLEKLGANYKGRAAKQLVVKSKVMPASATRKLDKKELHEEAKAVREARAARREERRRRREAKAAVQVHGVPAYVPKPPQSILLDTPELIASATAHSCMYPNRFLDGHRTCNGCRLHEHCACSVKHVVPEDPPPRQTKKPRKSVESIAVPA